MDNFLAMESSDVFGGFPDLDLDFGCYFDLDIAAALYDDFAVSSEKNSTVPSLDCPDPGSAREGSPDSAVSAVIDGPVAGDGALSTYLNELERFLMGDDVEEGVIGPAGSCAEGYVADGLFSDLLAHGKGVAAEGVGGGEKAEEYVAAEVVDMEQEEQGEGNVASRKRKRGIFMKPREELYAYAYAEGLKMTRKHLDAEFRRFSYTGCCCVA